MVTGSEEAYDAGFERGLDAGQADAAYEIQRMAKKWREQAKQQRLAAHQYANTEVAKVIATVLEECAKSADKLANNIYPEIEESDE